ncbi:MAG: alpha/beta fold hydrolase, partial [Thermoanaerobaculia bacterium]|nr:alpha/beta fold hydrolase [Thermoanaerobaculia bacterium]
MKNFPIGYRHFHDDESYNFELNRWLPALPEPEVVELAKRITCRDDWTRETSRCARAAEERGEAEAAAFYWRAVEFFLPPGDPAKASAYTSFREQFEIAIAGQSHRRYEVPFDSGHLPAIELCPQGEPRDTVVLHGGFDSFQEELWDWGRYLSEAGYRVVIFEGPGQGAALRHHGLTMAADWERPVAAILDHFAIETCSILGISLGGYLAPRAAAFEPRIERVIACDVLDDFFDCFAQRAGRRTARTLSFLVRRGQRAILNRLMDLTTARDAATAWAFAHGMQVSGASDPFEFLCWLKELSTVDFSHRITQDFLLLAGTRDHIVPLHQFYRQARNLPNVRSFTGRVFSEAEQAHNHCQIGNVGLALA